MRNTTRIFHLVRVIVCGVALVGTSGGIAYPSHAAPAASILRVTTMGATSGSCGSAWGTACGLQYALSIAVPGDEVWVAVGTYTPTTGSDPNATFVLPSSVGVYGGFGGITETTRSQRNWAANVTTLSGNLSGGAHAYHVVTANGTDSTTTLDGFTVTGGQAPEQGGGGVYVNNGSLTIANCRIANNSAEWGGGVFQEGASQRLDVTGSRIELNTVGFSGGGMFVRGSAALTDTLVLSNTSGSYGGGLTVWAGRTDLTGGLFAANRAGDNGGGVDVNNNISITGTQFISNTASGGGGLLQWNGDTVTVTNARFERNQANGDGGAFWAHGNATLSGGVFENNACTGASCNGGGLYVTNTLTLTGTQFISNTAAGWGGGAFANGGATLSGGLFQNNQSGWLGGGLFAYDTLTLTGTQFLSNTAASDGGGAYAWGAATLSGGLFQNNTCTEGGCNGGGLFTPSTLALTGTQFLSNTAYLGGGAYANDAATLSGGLFQNNQSTNGHGGGLDANYTLTLTGTQFISNTAAGDGGGAFAGGVATLSGGLFQNNQSTYGAGCTRKAPSP